MQPFRAFLALSLSACALRSRTAADTLSGEADRYAIYSAALAYLYPPSTRSHLVILSHTIDAVTPTSAQERTRLGFHTLISEEWWSAYLEANRNALPIGNCFRGIPNITLTDSARAVPEPDVIWLSAIGFNASHTEALVSVMRRCGPWCGEGALLVLIRSGREWKVQSTPMTMSF
jgi:hypothetical protein